MSPRGSGWTPARIAVVVAVAVLLTAGLALPARAPSAAAPAGGPSSGAAVAAGTSPWVWDNGLISLIFPNPVPSFTIQSDRNASLSTRHVLTGVAEITPTDNATSFAPFDQSGANWRFASAEGASSTTVWLNATLKVVGAVGSWESPDDVAELEDSSGTAQVSLAFYLNASTAPDPAAVRFTVNVTHWPWINTSDSIGFGFVDVAVPGTSIRPGASPNSLVEVRSQDQATLSTLSWASQATVYYRTGGNGNSSVGTYRAIAANGTNSTIHLEFGAVAGGYTDLSFDPWIRLNLSALAAAPPIPAWLWTPQSLGILALAVAATAVLAIFAARSRSGNAPPP